ncbi:MAG: methyltransferase [Bacteroidetes bacterium]|nr:methyltransferase [Bacteroidota bacterium]
MISVCKKILSYFWEFKLESIYSEYSGNLEVSFFQNNYKLSTQNATYSYGKLYTSFKTAFEAIDIFNREIINVLILGIGLGSVIEQLNQHKTIQQIDAVDIDAQIIYLCKKYLNTNHDINYIHSDAFQFIDTCNKKYDLILIDIFIDDQTPEIFLTEKFLHQIQVICCKSSIVLFSKLNVSELNRRENEQFGNYFRAIFPNSFSITTDGNLVFTSIS